MGTVILVGGALSPDNKVVFEKILEHCGPRIGLFSTASSNPDKSWETDAAMFKTHGFDPQRIDITLQNAATQAHDPQVLAKITSCTGFYFGGGDQRNLTQALLGTPALEVLRCRFTEGAGVSGSSAGTAVMADPMISGGRSLDTWLGEGEPVTVEPGFGFIENLQVDQHFLAWGRFGRLIGAMGQAQVSLGVGVDENTALVIPEQGAWEVVGISHVVFVERTPIGLQISLLAQGDRFDPTQQTFLIHPQRRPIGEPDLEVKNIASTDIFGSRALTSVLIQLIESAESSAVGLSFGATAEAAFSARGIRARFFKTPSTQGYYGNFAPGDRYSVLRVGLQFEAIRVRVEVESKAEG
ncbi:cyanophycinase [Meiothermus sp.]|uniref:cyanophycinase n=1 Tax=Meiothermus sp. TaxID=1955249 RepID=UPI00307EBBA0